MGVEETFLIKGVYCCFDYSDFQNQKGRADILLRYIDAKIPQIFQEFESDLPKDKINISFYDESKACYDKDKKIIKYGIKLSPKDLGCLIHEVVHYIQDYGIFCCSEQPENLVIAEGLADYFRHKLSDDGWDNPDEQNPYPHNKFHGIGCRACTAEFISWLEKKAGDDRFIINLHLFLKNKSCDDQSNVNPFMQRYFGKDFKPLLDEFEVIKSKIVSNNFN